MIETERSRPRPTETTPPEREMLPGVWLRQRGEESEVEALLPQGEIEAIVQGCRASLADFATPVLQYALQHGYLDPASIHQDRQALAEGLFRMQVLAAVIERQKVPETQISELAPTLRQAFHLAFQGQFHLTPISPNPDRHSG